MSSLVCPSVSFNFGRIGDARPCSPFGVCIPGSLPIEFLLGDAGALNIEARVIFCKSILNSINVNPINDF